MSDYRVIAIGAGVAGLTCARSLQGLGVRVQVLEKSRGLGGRVATRRVTVSASQAIRVDHGAQYISPKSDAFQTQIQAWMKAGAIGAWTRSLHVLDECGLHPDGKTTLRYACADGMTAIAKHLAADLDICYQTRVREIRPHQNRWVVRAEGDRELSCDAVVVAVPAPQASIVLEAALDRGEISADEPAVRALQAARYAPCLAVMAGYRDEIAAPEWQGVQWLNDDIVAWTGLDSSKRERQSAPTIVIHSTAAFARQYLDASRDTLDRVGRQMLERASEPLGAWLAAPEWTQVHRWRYALPENPTGELSYAISAAGAPLVLAGDWCASSRVEGAWRSGLNAAARLERAIAQTVVTLD